MRISQLYWPNKIFDSLTTNVFNTTTEWERSEKKWHQWPQPQPNPSPPHKALAKQPKPFSLANQPKPFYWQINPNHFIDKSTHPFLWHMNTSVFVDKNNPLSFGASFRQIIVFVSIMVAIIQIQYDLLILPTTCLVHYERNYIRGTITISYLDEGCVENRSINRMNRQQHYSSLLPTIWVN